MKNKQKRKNKFISILGEAILWVLALFCISFAVINTIDAHTNYSCSYFGTRTSVVVSESMAYENPENEYLDGTMSRIKKYDVVFAKEVKYEEINIYDVVLHVENGTLICHRVVDKYEYNGVSYLVTRGDSNNMDDAPFAYSSCRGKVMNVIPNIGEIVLFFQSGYFFLGLFFSIFLISLVLFLLSIYKNKHQSIKTQKEVINDVSDNNSKELVKNTNSKEDKIENSD